MSFGEGFASGATMVTKFKGAKKAEAGKDTKPADAPATPVSKGPASDASPMDRLRTWVGEKIDGLGSTATAADSTATALTKGGSGDVGLVERLKAGNIDDPKSEAYARWGKGKGATVTPVGDASKVSEPEPLGPGGTFTKEMWDAAPDAGAGANPAWEELNKNMEA